MEQKQIIYTHGNVWIEVEELIRLLQPYGIDCVVDSRPANLLSIGANTRREALQSRLKQCGMIYLSFSSHFGVFPMDARNKRGVITYKKVIKTERFIQGMERLEDGVKKGYKICVIDNERRTDKSFRFTLIGKFLKERYCVVHIDDRGTSFSQEQVEQKLVDAAIRRKEKVKIAQNVGRTGEELTALYLVRNGYQILSRNWNLHRGCELDIVAMRDNLLHFIEVKTRTSDLYGEPQTAINRQKLRHISKAIQAYRDRCSMLDVDYQIDSVAILYRSDQDYDLKHFLGIRMDGGACDEVISFNKRP